MTGKRIRQYIGIVLAVLFYYVLHEGAHAIASLGIFRDVRFFWIGIQTGAYAATNRQLIMLCLAGFLATETAGIILALCAPHIFRIRSKMIRSVLYYTSLAVLLIDPFRYSVFGGWPGGDLNGIGLLMQETAARIGFAVILIINTVLFFKRIFPPYVVSFLGDTSDGFPMVSKGSKRPE